MQDHYHPGRAYRRGPRIARFLTALAFFAATTAGLHALSDHYGWRPHHGGMHPSGDWGWSAPHDSPPASAPKQPT